MMHERLIELFNNATSKDVQKEDVADYLIKNGAIALCEEAIESLQGLVEALKENKKIRGEGDVSVPKKEK